MSKTEQTTESPFTSRADAYIYVMMAFRWGSEVTGFYGMSQTGARGEKPKGFFLEGEQTEYGYEATALRIYSDLQAKGLDPWTGQEINEEE